MTQQQYDAWFYYHSETEKAMADFRNATMQNKPDEVINRLLSEYNSAKLRLIYFMKMQIRG